MRSAMMRPTVPVHASMLEMAMATSVATKGADDVAGSNPQRHLRFSPAASQPARGISMKSVREMIEERNRLVTENRKMLDGATDGKLSTEQEAEWDNRDKDIDRLNTEIESRNASKVRDDRRKQYDDMLKEEGPRQTPPTPKGGDGAELKLSYGRGELAGSWTRSREVPPEFPFLPDHRPRQRTPRPASVQGQQGRLSRADDDGRAAHQVPR